MLSRKDSTQIYTNKRDNKARRDHSYDDIVCMEW